MTKQVNAENSDEKNETVEVAEEQDGAEEAVQQTDTVADAEADAEADDGYEENQEEMENDEDEGSEDNIDDDDDDDIQYIDEVGEDDEDEAVDEEKAGSGEEGDKKKAKSKSQQKSDDKSKKSTTKDKSTKSKSSSSDRKKKSSSDRKRKDDGEDDSSAKRQRSSRLDPFEAERKRREERDEKSLFLNNLPKEITVEGIKQLSADILDVRIPQDGRRYMVTQYAFIEFKDEATAEKNYKLLSGKEIDNHILFIDFCGKKSNKEKRDSINKKKLHVPDIPVGVAVDVFQKFMKDATQLSTILRGEERFLFATFETEEAAEKALKENENLEIEGKKLTVQYAAVQKKETSSRSSSFKRSYSPYRSRGSFNRGLSSGRGSGRSRGGGFFRDRDRLSSRSFRRGFGRGFRNRMFY